VLQMVKFTDDDSSVDQVPLFCFPVQYKLARNEMQPVSFPFCVVNSKNEKMLGTCLMFWLECNDGSLSSGSVYAPFCLCLLSTYPAFNATQSFLSKIYDEGYLGMTSNDILSPKYLEKIVEQVSIDLSSICRLPWKEFPVIDFQLSQLFEVLELHTVLSCVRAILFECKIIFCSSQVSLLTFVAESLLCLCYPFTWTHIYVPLLPNVLARFAQAPVPFIVGVHKSYLDNVLSGIENPSSVVLVDIDKSEVVFDFDKQGIPVLPKALLDSLTLSVRKVLKPEMFVCDSWKVEDSPKDESAMQFSIRAIFSTTWHELLRGYREHLLFYVQSQNNTVLLDEGDSEILGRKGMTEVPTHHCHDDPIFDYFSFLESSPEELKTFFEVFLKTQNFSSFIEAHKSNPNLLYVTRSYCLFHSHSGYRSTSLTPTVFCDKRMTHVHLNSFQLGVHQFPHHV
jgi:hypothetical protein